MLNLLLASILCRDRQSVLIKPRESSQNRKCNRETPQHIWIHLLTNNSSYFFLSHSSSSSFSPSPLLLLFLPLHPPRNKLVSLQTIVTVRIQLTFLKSWGCWGPGILYSSTHSTGNQTSRLVLVYDWEDGRSSLSSPEYHAWS